MEAAIAPADPPSVPLHQLLREHTASAHARLDAGLGGGLHDADEYAAYLEGMSAFLDDALAVLGAEAWLVDARRLIAGDLGVAPPVLPSPPSNVDDARAAGWRYVVAGASMGARLLLRDARRLCATSPQRTAFLDAFAAGDAWPRCLALLRDTGFDAQARARACDAALEAFHAAEAALFRAKALSNAA